MEHSDFVIGETFWWGELPWRCSDIGTRVVMAIRFDIDTYSISDMKPPNGMVEEVFDESAIKDCTVDPPLNEAGEPPKPRIGTLPTFK
jgi:hypothetical protein